ncbi:hypothetical protein UY3_07262 [Chelonia mydas]|uniref:Uncharacterized protein n=1 Tax=Chelonia mydas TaxID=8469 RepID=M7C4X0_CHEMY|nr:hypothetical protein UY3_07262 [Chelonia mydas]
MGEAFLSTQVASSLSTTAAQIYQCYQIQHKQQQEKLLHITSTTGPQPTHDSHLIGVQEQGPTPQPLNPMRFLPLTSMGAELGAEEALETSARLDPVLTPML